MKTYLIREPKGISSLIMEESTIAEPGRGQVRVSLQAWSLNYRDLAMPAGGYLNNTKVVDNPPLVPLSDAAGEVISVGEGVTRFSPGDRVATCFFQNWIDGPITNQAIASGLGGAIDGVLAEEVILSEQGLVAIPDDLSFEHAACLPCAATTAWEALCLANTDSGDTLLTLGTGGVSIFALQLAKALGAQVIITSSSDNKLERASELGADITINHKKFPDWDAKVLDVTEGIGVEHVIELGGAGTFERSLNAAKSGGQISLIGVLSGEPQQQPSPMMILFKRLCVQGIYVGPRSRLESLVSFISEKNITPIIDSRFAFDQAQKAYRFLKSGSHFGKVVIVR